MSLYRKRQEFKESIKMGFAMSALYLLAIWELYKQTRSSKKPATKSTKQGLYTAHGPETTERMHDC